LVFKDSAEKVILADFDELPTKFTNVSSVEANISDKIRKSNSKATITKITCQDQTGMVVEFDKKNGLDDRKCLQGGRERQSDYNHCYDWNPTGNSYRPVRDV